MAVDRALWWSVWWPWVLVWCVTALAIVVAVGSVGWAWRVRRRYTPARQVPGITFYLHKKSVLDLYQAGGYGDAISREVEERVGTQRKRKLGVAWRSANAAGEHSSEREVVSRYFTEADPIAVIGVLLDALEAADGVVHVDLRDRTVVDNVAVARLRDRSGGGPAPVRLRGIDSYVSIRGVFRVADHLGSRTVLLAPFGDPDDPEDGPQVRLECHHDGLRDGDLPDGPFQARCLGKVQSWKAGRGELVVRPVAIFQ
ncbi:hypothetical protein [Actinokineospora inagensis]|uniref:hypothetical protein n=1 Tax=Actinokineospora inagensis TaxID=103730 RepID=UPI00047D72C6|nr:hypothetical protein [Actinokineospora inagensis]